MRKWFKVVSLAGLCLVALAGDTFTGDFTQNDQVASTVYFVNDGNNTLNLLH